MYLTDHEWLRFVTFGLFAGGTLGALYNSALLALGNTLLGSTAGAVLAAGIFAILFHLLARWLLTRETEPDDQRDATDTEDAT